MTDEHANPYKEVEPKRTYQKVTLEIDWHDWLINQRFKGTAYAVGECIRPKREEATGLEYRCTTAGVTGKRPPLMSTTIGGTVADGSVVWTAQAISTSSLRSTIVTSQWVADSGITLSDQSDSDLIYSAIADGGVDGQTYRIKHQIILANNEKNEAVAVLAVND